MPAFQPADEPIPTIGYIRVSLAREETISPELQRESITKWAQRTGHRIVDWVEDLDKSGRNFKRRIMGVIERVEGGEARVIAVWKYSRFGRTRTGVPANLARVEKAGGQLLSATEEVDARTAIGRFQRGMIMEFNAFESDRAGEQWAETHQWRRDQGLPAMGGERFGYVWHRRKIYQPDGTVTLQEERYEPDPGTAAVVTGLYTRYVTGTPFRSLALELNEQGHRTVRGVLWSAGSVKRYLDSGFAAGYLRFHRKNCPGEATAHSCNEYDLVRHPTLHHPALITDDTWQQYTDRRGFTRTAAPRARNATYPLTGLVRCGECQWSARRSADSRGIREVRYRCNRRWTRGPHACPGTSVMLSVIEASIKAFLVDVADETSADAASGSAESPTGQRRQDSEARRRAELEESVARLERSISRHMRAYAMAEDDGQDGELEREYLATLKELRLEKSAVKSQLADLVEDLESGGAEQRRAAAVPVAVGLLAEWDSMPAPRINVLLRQVISRVDLLSDRSARVVPAWS